MNQRRILPWSGGLVLAILVVLAVAFSVAAQPGRSPTLEESFPLVEPAMSSPSYKVLWDVIASGGGVATSASFRLHHTIGQPSFGTMTSASYILHAGFWQLFLNNIFLPIIQR